MMRALWLIALLLAFPAASTGAASGGSEPFAFLSLDANARAVALGGAYTALASDANALLYDPAGLARVRRQEATFMHNQHFQGITQEYIGYASPRGWGLSLNYLTFGAIPKTTVANPDGTGLGSAGLSDLALGAGYGRTLTDALALGAGAKVISETIDDVTARGLALDLGALYAVPAVPRLSLGAAVLNLGPAVKFQSANEDLPMSLRLGAAYGFAVLEQDSTLAMDIVKGRSQDARLAIGAETVIAKAMPVRLGYKTDGGTGPGISAGLGWRNQNFDFDYAYMPFGDLGVAHRLSATVRWGTARTVDKN